MAVNSLPFYDALHDHTLQARAGCSLSPGWQNAPTHCHQETEDKNRLAASWDQTHLPAQCTRVTYVTTGLAQSGTLLWGSGNVNIVSPGHWRGLKFDFFFLPNLPRVRLLACRGSQNENFTYILHQSTNTKIDFIGDTTLPLHTGVYLAHQTFISWQP